MAQSLGQGGGGGEERGGSGVRRDRFLVGRALPYRQFHSCRLELCKIIHLL